MNCGSMDMLDQLGAVNQGTRCGASTQVSGMAIPKTNTGGEHSKHGIWHGDLVRACEKIKSNGLALQACTCTSAQAWTTRTCRKCAVPC